MIPWRNEEMVLECRLNYPLASLEELRPETLEGIYFIGFDDDLPIRREVNASSATTT